MSDLEAAQQGATVAPAQNSETPSVQAEGSVTTNEQVEAQQQEQPRDEKGRYVPIERFNQVYGRQKEAERQIASLQHQLQQIQQPQRQFEVEGLPDISQYNDVGQWSQDLGRTLMEQATRQAEQQLSERQHQEYQQRISNDFKSREEAYAATNPQYYENVELFAQAFGNPHPVILEALAVSDHGPAIVDYLAQHLEEADRISRLPPHLAAVHLGRIEASVSTPKPKTVSQAPTPAPTLKGGAISQKDPAAMSYAEYKAFRQNSGNE